MCRSSEAQDPPEQLWDGGALMQITLLFSGQNRDICFGFFQMACNGSIESRWIIFEPLFLDLLFSPENSQEYLSEIQMNALL